jgi:hypothetical protein
MFFSRRLGVVVGVRFVRLAGLAYAGFFVVYSVLRTPLAKVGRTLPVLDTRLPVPMVPKCRGF